MATVDVLLATYNAGGFLEQQIDSLLAQTFADWRLLIRDDCSRDGTARVVEHYAARDRARIVVIDSPPRNEGSRRGFSALLERSAAPYVMLCDQDDVWLPEKIERSLDGLRRLETTHGSGTPLLVHTDLRVVDETLRPLADSFWSLHSLDPRPRRPLRRLFMQNFVSGCASIFNRSLREAAAPIPAAALVHDWWLALVAAALGRIGCLPEATVLYRQHDRNQIGALRPAPSRPTGAAEARGRAPAGDRRPLLWGLRRIRRDVRRQELQVGALLERCGGRLAADDRKAAESFSRLSCHNFAARRYQLLAHGLSSCGFRRNLEIWLSI